MATENTFYTRSGKMNRMMKRVKKIYFIGIGGVSMRILARMCAERGYLVSGSDAVRGEATISLRSAGIPVFSPDENSPIIDADMAVYTTAVSKTHPEYQSALRRGIPLVSRADLFGFLMQEYRERIGVAGTHGKSTVTAMCGAVLAEGNKEPTVAVGAEMPPSHDGYIPGSRDVLAFEACEYYDSFLCFSPTIALITNVEWDHPDYFRDFTAVLSSFRAYLSLPSVRCAVVSAADEGARRVATGLSLPVVTFGIGEGDVSAREIERLSGGSGFTLDIHGQPIGRVRLRVPGRHNILNALAATAATLGAGVDEGALLKALSSFRGIGRRLELRGESGGVLYYDDYAHHPTEITASLSALRKKGKLFCIYQPHTYTRTAELFPGLAAALRLADTAVLVDIYAAREEDTRGTGSAALATAVGGSARYIPTPEEAVAFVRKQAEPGDTVVVMGAGDIGSRVFTGDLAFLPKPEL